MSFTGHLKTRFSGCVVIGTARDECRNRDVQILRLPETDDYVGINDGVDVFISPSVNNPYGVNVRQALHQSRAPSTRRRFTTSEAQSVTSTDKPTMRRRIAAEAPAVPSARKRFTT